MCKLSCVWFNRATFSARENRTWREGWPGIAVGHRRSSRSHKKLVWVMLKEEFRTHALFNLAVQLGRITAARGIVKCITSEHYIKTCKLFSESNTRSCFRSYRHAFFPLVLNRNSLTGFFLLQAVRICLWCLLDGTSTTKPDANLEAKQNKKGDS